MANQMVDETTKNMPKEGDEDPMDKGAWYSFHVFPVADAHAYVSRRCRSKTCPTAADVAVLIQNAWRRLPAARPECEEGRRRRGGREDACCSGQILPESG